MNYSDALLDGETSQTHCRFDIWAFLLRKYTLLSQVAKVLSPKRSQLVGILLSSLRVDVSDIEQGTLSCYMSNKPVI